MNGQTMAAAFRSGGEAELRAVMELYSHRLLKFCHEILCDYHEAQDAVQTTFVRAYERRAALRNEEALQAWLYGIAYRAAVDILRRRDRGRPVGLPMAGQNPDYMGEEVRSMLLALEPIDRALLWGRAVEEQSYAELSQILGKSSAALRKRYERAIKRAAAILRPEGTHEIELEAKNESTI